MLEIIRTQTKKNFDHYMANVTEAQKAKAQEEEQQFLAGDEQYMQEAEERMSNMFKEADTD